VDARGIIDRAMATLTTRPGMTEREAFRWLQRTAMEHRSSMRAIAWLVIADRPARKATSSIGQQDAVRATTSDVNPSRPTSRGVPG
jgi:ANTAR domain